MNILFLTSSNAILLATTSGYLFVYTVLFLSFIWLVAYNIHRRRKPGYRGPLSFQDNEYAEDRFLGI